jgi:Right handed beta helix region
MQMRRPVGFLLVVLLWSCLAAMGQGGPAGTGAKPRDGNRQAANLHGQRRTIIPKSDSGYYLGVPEINAFHPGDTIVLRASDAWSYFAVANFRGDAARPLVIINEGGQVKMRDGIRLPNDTYVKVAGVGSPDKYGFMIEQDPFIRPQTAGAMQVGRRSKGIEISHVYIHNCGMGFICKTDGDCADSLNYPNWVLDSISIHDCRIVGMWNEGMYIGNTSPDNAPDSYDPRPVMCDGRKTYPMPMRLGNIRVYDNYVDSTGRGGIQLSAASVGMSEIYQNIVRHNGLNGDDEQGTGISVGTYCHVYIHDNVISDCYTWGIASLGGSGTGVLLRIENNRIDSVGWLRHYRLAQTERYLMDERTEPDYPEEIKWPYAIELGTRPTLFKDSTTFWIRNNIIGAFRSHVAAIQLHDGARSITPFGNIISGNKNADGGPATIYVDNTHVEINYTDSSGAKTTVGRIYGRKERLLWLALYAGVGTFGLACIGGLIYLRRRKRRGSLSARGQGAERKG